MCGIAGIVDFQGRLSQLGTDVQAMSETLVHRGPDGAGEWIDEQVGIAFSHRRLSIQDLSQEGAQPMISATGRFVVVYNGEIYNFKQIRVELERAGHWFHGNSDTEVMLSAFDEWGVQNSVSRFIGAFSFAVWDRRMRELLLVRDRIGEKPLYYGTVDDVFVFASELKAIRVSPGFLGEIDRDILVVFLRYGFVPAPYTIYKQYKKLPPGSILTLKYGEKDISYRISRYWSLESVVGQGASCPYIFSFDDAEIELDQLLRDAVSLRMLADVPVGAFLSGGIDSSLIVAMMQSSSSRAIKTFTLGFHEHGYDEAGDAKLVASYLGTDHSEFYVSSDEAISIIPRIPFYYDEPFADSSQLPTLLISEFAGKHVKVSLSGDGGDELFYGYRRYYEAETRWRQIVSLPSSIRKLLTSLLGGAFPDSWSKPNTLADMLALNSKGEMYKWLISIWKDPGSIVIGANEAHTTLDCQDDYTFLHNLSKMMMFYDMSQYLPDDILVKMDRASMAVGLENRVPILDHRIIEFSCRLPLHFKRRKDTGKYILRKVLSRYLPQHFVKKSKKGFGVPIGEWLRGPLREWAEELLDENRMNNEGYFSSEAIRYKWQSHISGSRDYRYELWNILMFQSWLESTK